MRKWWPLVAICLGAFMLLVDGTIVIVALPDMAADLNTSFADLQWVLDGYALTLAALLLGAGTLADRIGRRRLYLIGLALFALSSLACGLATTSGVLITARAVQGVSAAAMFATTMALLNSVYQGRERGIAYGIWGAVNGAAAAAGPILGGLLTEHLGWRTIFLVNLPISVVAVVLARRVLPEALNPHAHRIDLPGMVTFTVAAGALTYGFISASEHSWASTRTLGALGLGIAGLVLFIAVESRRRDAMLDLSLFLRSPFIGLMIAATLVNAAAFAGLVYTSLWLQSVLDLGAVGAGLTLLPLSVSAFVVAGLTGRFLHNASPRWMIGIGMLLIGAGTALQALLHADSGRLVLVPGLIVAGIGVGLTMPSLASAAMASVPPARAGMAAGAVNTFRQLGYALGLALLGVVFQARLEHFAGAAADALSGGQARAVIASSAPGRRGAVDHVVHAAFAGALNATALVAAALGVLAGVLTLLLVRGETGSEPTSQPQLDASGSR